MANKEIKVTLKKSLIGSTEKQRKVVRALGLRRVNQTVVHHESDIIKGMINKVPHLLSVE